MCIRDSARTGYHRNRGFGPAPGKLLVNGFKTVLDYDDDYNLSKITTPSGKTFGVKQDKFCLLYTSLINYLKQDRKVE